MTDVTLVMRQSFHISFFLCHNFHCQSQSRYTNKFNEQTGINVLPVDKRMINWCCSTVKLWQSSQYPRSHSKVVLKNVSEFKWKHLCLSLFFIKKESQTVDLDIGLFCKFCGIFHISFFKQNLWETNSILQMGETQLKILIPVMNHMHW